MSAAVGPLNYSIEEGTQKPFSEETGSLIDDEVRKVIDSCYKRCRDILTERKDLV